jgi:tetratricopeptide (TPR) repeat protein
MKYRVLFSSLLGAALAAGMLEGCVYYNGMYNANRLARSARKAEREGRTFEASNLWGQVATKAESVVVRHPTSKYAHEAGVLRGVALARLGQCEQAMGPLSRVGLAATPRDLNEDALLATGRCQVAQGNLAAADAAFSQLVNSKNFERRREARFQHARLLRQAGRYGEALEALGDQREPRADTERILALAGAGRLSDALALADSLTAKGDTTMSWDSVVVALGRRDPNAASSLVDRVRRLPNRRPETQARLLLEDGLRLIHSDTSVAAKRLRQAMGVGSSGEAAGRAGLALVRLDLRRASQPEHLPPVVKALQRLAERYELVSEEIRQLSATVTGVHTAGVSITPMTPQGDLRLFLAAEAARDSLDATRLAEGIFRRILEEWPASPYAPKAVLAAQQLDSTWVDSARVILEERYLDSPYLAMIRGDASSEYRQLEDSLGAFAASLTVAPPAGGVRRRPPVRADPREPGRRPQPVPGGSRVPEPQ